MSIINRRNAIFGYTVWVALKALGKQKARQAVPGRGDYAGLNKGAIATIGAATVAAALLAWRLKSEESAA
jgi:hypothetical protein